VRPYLFRVLFFLILIGAALCGSLPAFAELQWFFRAHEGDGRQKLFVKRHPTQKTVELVSPKHLAELITHSQARGHTSPGCTELANIIGVKVKELDDLVPILDRLQAEQDAGKREGINLEDISSYLKSKYVKVDDRGLIHLNNGEKEVVSSLSLGLLQYVIDILNDKNGKRIQDVALLEVFDELFKSRRISLRALIRDLESRGVSDKEPIIFEPASGHASPTLVRVRASSTFLLKEPIIVGRGGVVNLPKHLLPKSTSTSSSTATVTVSGGSGGSGSSYILSSTAPYTLKSSSSLHMPSSSKTLRPWSITGFPASSLSGSGSSAIKVATMYANGGFDEDSYAPSSNLGAGSTSNESFSFLYDGSLSTTLSGGSGSSTVHAHADPSQTVSADTKSADTAQGTLRSKRPYLPTFVLRDQLFKESRRIFERRLKQMEQGFNLAGEPYQFPENRQIVKNKAKVFRRQINIYEGLKSEDPLRQEEIGVVGFDPRLPQRDPSDFISVTLPEKPLRVTYTRDEGVTWMNFADPGGVNSVHGPLAAHTAVVYVNFANSSLGGDYLGKGLAQEESQALESFDFASLCAVHNNYESFNNEIFTRHGKSDQDRPYAHPRSADPKLITGLIYRMIPKNLNDNLSGMKEAKFEVANSFDEYRHSPSVQMLALAGPKVRPGDRGKPYKGLEDNIYDMYNNAVLGFSLSKTYNLDQGKMRIKIITGPWTAGVFGQSLGMSIAVQYFAAKMAGIDELQFSGVRQDIVEYYTLKVDQVLRTAPKPLNIRNILDAFADFTSHLDNAPLRTQKERPYH